MSEFFVRRLTASELADLPNGWENIVLSRKQYVGAILEAFEVDQQTYETHKAKGLLCQKVGEKYYAA